VRRCDDGHRRGLLNVSTINPNLALTDIVKAVIVLTRPEEMILVDALLQNHNKAEKEEMLGFGAGVSVAVLAPVLIAFLKEARDSALKVVAEDIGKKIAEHFTSEKETRLNSAALQNLRDAFSQHLQDAGFDSNDTLLASDSLVDVIVGHPEWLQAIVKH
jgi:hypothetical protein